MLTYCICHSRIRHFFILASQSSPQTSHTSPYWLIFQTLLQNLSSCIFLTCLHLSLYNSAYCIIEWTFNSCLVISSIILSPFLQPSLFCPYSLIQFPYSADYHWSKKLFISDYSNYLRCLVFSAQHFKPYKSVGTPITL